MAALNELKSYLKDLNYPGINLMQDDEIADVFNKKNRQYFLTWFVQKWDPDIVLPIDEKTKADTLSDILCDSGFCTSQESVKFVQNSFELEPDEQLTIINRMLYNLRILSLADENDICEINYAEQMEILSKLDVNIFPTMGPIQVRKPEERLEKMEKVERDIKELKQEIESMNNKYNSNVDVDRRNETDWLALDLVRDQISTLMNNSVSILKYQKDPDKGVFDDCFETAVSDCVRNISEVLKLYENKKAIGEFALEQDSQKDGNADKELAEAIKQLSLLSQEVVNAD